MESQYGAVRASLQGLTGRMPGMVDAGALADTRLPLGTPAWAAVPRETRPVHITVNTLTADAAPGRPSSTPSDTTSRPPAGNS